MKIKVEFTSDEHNSVFQYDRKCLMSRRQIKFMTKCPTSKKKGFTLILLLYAQRLKTFVKEEDVISSSRQKN